MVQVHVTECRPFPNERTEERTRRYVIDPLALARLEDELEPTDERIIGIYHSHPDHPARPSDFDREHAWPGLSYVIVHSNKDGTGDLTSWRLAEDRTLFHQERIITTPAPANAEPEADP